MIMHANTSNIHVHVTLLLEILAMGLQNGTRAVLHYILLLIAHRALTNEVSTTQLLAQCYFSTAPNQVSIAGMASNHIPHPT